MEKLLTIMSMTENPNSNKELLLTYKMPKALQNEEAVNYCIRCFNGLFCVQYHKKKGFGLKCNNCHFRLACLEKAGALSTTQEKCAEC